MLSGPAILRISVLLLLAGALAALVQYWMPASPQPPAKTAVATSAPAPSEPPVRKIPSAAPPDTVIAAPTPPPAPPKPQPAPISPPPPPQVPSEALAFPAPPPSAAPEGRQEVTEAETTEGPPAVALVDLNTASVADLNRLRGGGAIGRAIVAKRPYTQVGDLLTKRVLSRSVYERIREQVTVR